MTISGKRRYGIFLPQDKWLSLNIDKEKGKQKIDLFYKKKNA